MLQEIVSNHQPLSWTRTNYDGQCYQLFDLQPNTPEYIEVTQHFTGLNVTKIQRIQNPFVFGRYKLKKESLELTGCKEAPCYHPIRVAEVTNVAEFNCDHRRYGNRVGAQNNGKQPKFYSTPAQAVANFKLSVSGMMVVVVLRLLNADASWDSCYWPEYFVYVE